MALEYQSGLLEFAPLNTQALVSFNLTSSWLEPILLVRRQIRWTAVSNSACGTTTRAYS